jgi:peptidoglycan/LPS O-acetylase OafA/YrhL
MEKEQAAPGWLERISLRRIITSNRFIPEVDGFRFLAIFIVILAHITMQCAPPLSNSTASLTFRRAIGDGTRGVFLFFTISGFILALPFARHHLLGTKAVALGSYFKRRLIRLEPPYILMLLIRATVLVTGYKTIAFGVVGAHLAASLFYLHTLIFRQYSIINPPAWSLEIEIQFYILAPLLTAVFMVRSAFLRRTIIIGSIVVAGIVSILFLPPSGLLVLTLVNYFQYFAAGFLLCDLYLTNTHLSLPRLLWDLIGCAALLWILFSRNDFYPVILPFITICLYMAGFHGRFVRGFFSIPAVSIIGGMCYSIYLTHNGILSIMTDLLADTSLRTLSAVAQTTIIYSTSIVTVLAVGTLYFVLVERPCMDPNLPQKLAARFRRRVPS